MFGGEEATPEPPAQVAAPAPELTPLTPAPMLPTPATVEAPSEVAAAQQDVQPERGPEPDVESETGSRMSHMRREPRSRPEMRAVSMQTVARAEPTMSAMEAAMRAEPPPEMQPTMMRTVMSMSPADDLVLNPYRH